jgi:hypothetical protein
VAVPAKKKPAWTEDRSRQIKASRSRKPPARLITEGITHVLSTKGGLRNSMVPPLALVVEMYGVDFIEKDGR